MAKKRDLVWDNYYAPYASGFRSNTSQELKALAERMYMRHLTELAINRFKWSGLPNSIDPRFLEFELFRKALAVFYHDESYGKFMAVAGAPNGGLNYNENPISFTTYGNRYISKTLSSSDCVPIWANMLRTPDVDIVTYYARRLTELDITIELNSKNLRQTKIVYATDNTRLSYQNIMRQIGEGVEVIYGQEDALNPSNIQVLDLGGDPVGVLNLQISKSKLWNEAMTMLGINNANQDKKERLVADEVAANDEQVFATREIALKSRRLACEIINKTYKYADGTPLDLWVDFANDSEPAAPAENTPVDGIGIGVAS